MFMRNKIYTYAKRGFMKFLFVLFFSQSIVLPCTSAIISGKASPNGRPLLWKHRDSNAFENKLMFFKLTLLMLITVPLLKNILLNK